MRRAKNNRYILHLLAFITIGAQCLLCESIDAQIPCLTGFVRDPSGAPVAGGDLDFDDAASGLRLITPGDNTDVFGFYTVCLLPKVYHVSYAPPPGTNLVGLRIFNLNLQTSQRLDVTLNTGVVVTGVISDSAGIPIGGADVDVDSVGAGRVYTPGDKTDTIIVDGVYRIVVPANLHRLRVDPPPGSRFRGVEVDSVSIQNDTTINFVLPTGWLVSGQISNELGAPASGINIDLRNHATRQKIFLSKNKSNVSGAYSVAAPSGQFQMEFSPPSGSPLVGAVIDTVIISSDVVINAILKSGTRVTAVVTDENGTPITRADLDLTLESTLVRQFTPNDKTDKNGRATVTVLPDTYEIKVNPPPGLLLDKLVQRNVVISGDTLINIVLPPLNRVNVSGRVVNSIGLGISGASVAAITKPAGIPLTVKNAVTDNAGFFRAGIQFGTIDLMFIPPAGSRFVGKRFSDVTFLQDTVWGVVTLNAGVVASVRVVDGAGSPATGHTLGFVDVNTGAEVFVANNSVNMSGSVVVAAPPGNYDISVIPPPPQVPDSFTVFNVDMSRDTAFTIVISGPTADVSKEVVLRQNYPNPFNGSTRIPYLIRSDAEVSIVIYNIVGQQVRKLAFGQQSAGFYDPLWDALDDDGQAVSSGVYFVRLQTSTTAVTRKMLLLQ